MPSPFRFAYQAVTSALLAAAAAIALRGQPVIQADPIVVSETPLTADASGVTRIGFADSTPLNERSFTSLSSQVANLQVNASGAGSFGSMISLRGLSNTPYFSDPSVSVYFDDLPLAGVATDPVGLFGFASATIHRGSQPAAYGRYAEAGALVFRSGEPAAVAAGTFTLDAGNHRSRAAGVEYRTARGETADATIAATVASRDGYITNTKLGTHVDDQKGESAAARLRIRPTKSSEVTLQVLANRRRDGAQSLVPIGGPLFTVARAQEGTTDSDFGGAALKIAFDTAAGRLSATTSRTEWTLNPFANFLVLPPLIDSRLTQSQRAWNEELRFTSDAGATATWCVGAWFSDAHTTSTANRAIPGLFPIEVSQAGQNTRTAAVFGESTFTLAPNWKLIAAARVEEVRRAFDRTQTVPGPGHFAGRTTYDSVVPKLTSVHNLSADTQASFSIGTGAKPGGWSAYTDRAALAQFKTERLVSFEAGVDTALASRTVKLATRVFDYEISNYQVERSFTATDYIVVNAPRARALGAEVEVAWRPIDALTATASFGTTTITLRKFTDPFTGVSHAGKRAPYTPEYNLHAGATYRFGGGWFVAADAAAVGRTYFEESEDPVYASAAHAIANGRVGFETASWRASVYVENIADARYTTLRIPGIRHAVPGAPRTFGGELTLHW